MMWHPVEFSTGITLVCTFDQSHSDLASQLHAFTTGSGNYHVTTDPGTGFPSTEPTRLAKQMSTHIIMHCRIAGLHLSVNEPTTLQRTAGFARAVLNSAREGRSFGRFGSWKSIRPARVASRLLCTRSVPVAASNARLVHLTCLISVSSLLHHHSSSSLPASGL
jgi:hypothetical protein